MPQKVVVQFALLGCVAVSAGGCSLLFVHGPPSGHELMTSFSCTESRVPPILDVAGAVMGLGAAAVVSPQKTTSGSVTISSGSSPDAAVGTGVAVILGASAWLGFRRTGACRTAQRELLIRNTDSTSVSSVTPTTDAAPWRIYPFVVLNPLPRLTSPRLSGGKARWSVRPRVRVLTGNCCCGVGGVAGLRAGRSVGSARLRSLQSG